jgi:hypothetical protein
MSCSSSGHITKLKQSISAPFDIYASDSHYLLALATLGEATEIEMILIAKVSNEGNIALRYRRHFFIQTSRM